MQLEILNPESGERTRRRRPGCEISQFDAPAGGAIHALQWSCGGRMEGALFEAATGAEVGPLPLPRETRLARAIPGEASEGVLYEVASARFPRDLIFAESLDPDAVAQPLTFGLAPTIAAGDLVDPVPVAIPLGGAATLPAELWWPRRTSSAPPALLWIEDDTRTPAWMEFHPFFQFLANRGVAVLRFRLRGARGFGRAFRHAADGRLVEAGLEDLDAARSELVRRGADTLRIAVLGEGSWPGAVAATALVERAGRFTAAVDLGGDPDPLRQHELIATLLEPARTWWLTRLGDPTADAVRRDRERMRLPTGVPAAQLLLIGASAAAAASGATTGCDACDLMLQRLPPQRPLPWPQGEGPWRRSGCSLGWRRARRRFDGFDDSTTCLRPRSPGYGSFSAPASPSRPDRAPRATLSGATMETLDKYQVLEKIGVGGFGVVYKAYDPFIKRHVAIKTCTSEETETRERFMREAEIAGNLHHRNIVTVYDFGFEDGVPYLVQEYLSGEDLDRKIKRREFLSLPEKLLYLVQIARGLQYAHSRGVVHRDIKPANIRILEDDTAKIMDFGIAKLAQHQEALTQAGITLGTAAYLAPEQIRGGAYDARTDLFSFGVLAFELFALERPFQGAEISAVFYKILNEDPPPLCDKAPDCPQDLERIVRRCLEKEPPKRYAGFSELLHDLEALAHRRPPHVPEGQVTAQVTARATSTIPPSASSSPPPSTAVRVGASARPVSVGDIELDSRQVVSHARSEGLATLAFERESSAGRSIARGLITFALVVAAAWGGWRYWQESRPLPESAATVTAHAAGMGTPSTSPPPAATPSIAALPTSPEPGAASANTAPPAADTATAEPLRLRRRPRNPAS